MEAAKRFRAECVEGKLYTLSVGVFDVVRHLRRVFLPGLRRDCEQDNRRKTRRDAFPRRPLCVILRAGRN